MGAIATTRQTAIAVEEEAQYLTFMLGTEMFAIGILCIKEIIEYGNLTVVPMMPAFVRRVINLRGAVVPGVDLSARFGPPNSPTLRTPSALPRMRRVRSAIASSARSPSPLRPAGRRSSCASSICSSAARAAARRRR